jgi:hypothetical protein
MIAVNKPWHSVRLKQVSFRISHFLSSIKNHSYSNRRRKWILFLAKKKLFFDAFSILTFLAEKFHFFRKKIDFDVWGCCRLGLL